MAMNVERIVEIMSKDNWSKWDFDVEKARIAKADEGGFCGVSRCLEKRTRYGNILIHTSEDGADQTYVRGPLCDKHFESFRAQPEA